MVDNNQDNDEYQFADLDVMGSDMMDNDDSTSVQSEDVVESNPPQKNIMRNALIVIVLVIIAMLVYKFMGSFFSSKTTEQVASTKTSPPTIQPIPSVTQTKPIQPIVAPPPTTTAISNDQVNQKLSALEISQQNVRSEITTVNNQLNGLSSNLNALADKIAALSQTVNILADKLEQQSRELAVIAVRTKPKVVRRPSTRIVRPPLVYYIQAVIPGRAWLIATNGSTLTVREGTKIAGYGVVKLIDAIQGRVVMSSGRVIRFSQQDS